MPFRPTQARFMLRSAARYLTEPHPFGRNPVTQTPHPVQWSDLGKRAVRAGGLFFPGAALFFAWPFATAGVIKAAGGV